MTDFISTKTVPTRERLALEFAAAIANQPDRWFLVPEELLDRGGLQPIWNTTTDNREYFKISAEGGVPHRCYVLIKPDAYGNRWARFVELTPA